MDNERERERESRFRPNWVNRTLFHGDNLPVLKGMNSGTVDLIATDPPFNKGRDFHATPDSLAAGASFQDRWRWEDDHQQWVNEVAAAGWDDVAYAVEIARTTHSDDMGAFLSFIAIRLLEMKRVLKPTGSIYLHCDQTANAYLRILMDAVFGKNNLRNEIVWCYRGGGVPTKAFARKHDTILFYANGKGQTTFNKQYVPYSEASQKLVSDRGGVSIDGKTRDLERGASMPDWWTDINSLQTWSKERTGYPTQKPLELYERIVRASTNREDVVLDPFAGCATTCVAAERLGRQWVGIDLWDKAHDVVLERLEKEGLANPQGGDTTLSFADIIYITEPPVRDDQLDIRAVPHLETPMGKRVPGRESSRQKAEIKGRLLDEFGYQCAGCDRVFDHPDYLEVDHQIPRRDGGGDEYENRMLLCSPCNRRKGSKFTLSGLRQENKRLKFMRDQNA